MSSRHIAPGFARAAIFAVGIAGLGSWSEALPLPPPESPSPGAGKPSLVLVTVEGLRPDRLSAYRSGANPATPALDRLAAEGTVFEQVLAPSVSTLPSLATIMTGETSFRHGVWDDDFRFRLSSSAPTLAERLKKQGYQTGAFVASSLLEAGRGFERGFDTYQDGYRRPLTGAWTLVVRPARTVIPAAKGWLKDRPPNRPFFLWVHLVEPTIPDVSKTAPLAASGLLDSYPRRLTELDESLKDLLETLRSRKDYSRTVLLLTSDHGLGLGDHGEARAGAQVYETALRVPLILKAPDSAAAPGKRIKDLGGLLDIVPTLGRILGLPGRQWPGRDLLAPSGGEPPAYYATALMGREIFGWAPQELVARGSYRLILGKSTELYDLAADPEQKRDLSAERGEEVRRLREIRSRLTGGHDPPPAHFQIAANLPDELRRRIEALGYVPPTTEKAAARELTDTRRIQSSLSVLEESHFMSSFVRTAQLGPEPLLTEADPEALFTLLAFGQAHATRARPGEADRAAKILISAQKLYPLDSEVYHQLAHLAFPLRQYADAALFLRVAEALTPRNPSEVAYDLACALSRLGDKEQALSTLRRAIGLGFKDRDHIAADHDLDSLLSDPAAASAVELALGSP